MDNFDEQKDLQNQFDWNESLQGTIVGSFYFGYILTNFCGGQLAEWIGLKRMLMISLSSSILLTFVVPIAAFNHHILLIAVRILTGVAQGSISPALFQLLSYWMPHNELGLAFGLIAASGYVGAVITMPICAILSAWKIVGGWPFVYYAFGSYGILVFLACLFSIHDHPEQHPSISEVELEHIKRNTLSSKCDKHENSWVPWGKIVLSKKVWAITFTRFCMSWGNLFLMTKLPAYLRQVLHMPMIYNSYVNASIYIALGGSYLCWGILVDWVERHRFLQRTASRKLFQTVALLGSATFMALVPLFGCNILAIIVMLNLSMITLGLTAGGDSLIIVDIAPDYSGTIYGFTNALGSLPGFLAPMFVGFMLDLPDTLPFQQWSFLFWIGSAIYILGALIFLIFIDSNLEPWGQRLKTNQRKLSKLSNDQI
ncbi:sialin-like protein 7 [Sarcoptes scabiei]|uniref:Sialin-like protein 7 n=1 Tax=Sarcoptes scabiei TaxID=52283 RepID=A0A132ALD0_SARSC|nr:sialin-like protein 7 [Sarcoptes scabiei]